MVGMPRSAFVKTRVNVPSDSRIELNRHERIRDNCIEVMVRRSSRVLSESNAAQVLGNDQRNSFSLIGMAGIIQAKSAFSPSHDLAFFALMN